MRWPFARQTLKQDRTTDPATIDVDAGWEAAGGQDQDVVTIDAGAVTLTGPVRRVRHLVAAGLYGATDNAKPMSREEDHVMTGVYIGVGLLLAAGAGYLAWRYVLSDAQKVHAKDLLADTATKAKRAVRDAKGRLPV